MTLRLPWVLGLALALRLLPVLATRADAVVPDWPLPLDRDGVGYASYAENLWKGQGYVESTGDRSHRAPGYPLLIWATFLAGGYQFLLLRLVQAGLGTLSCWMLYRLVRRGWGEAAGLWAALAAGVYPPFVFYSPQVLNSTLYMALVLLTLLAVAWAAEGGLMRSAVAGVALGAAAQVAGTVLGAAPVLALWLAWRRRALAPALLMALGTAAVLAPWVVRNHRVHGSFILLDTNSGGVFYLGNVAYASWVDPAAPSPLEDVRRETDYHQRDEAGKDRLLRELTVSWIREHPGTFLKVWAAKFLHGWSPVPDRKSWPLVLASLLTYGPALLLGLWGAWRGLHAGHPLAWLMVLFLLAVSVTHAVFVVAHRHRVPLYDPVLLALGAGLMGKKEAA